MEELSMDNILGADEIDTLFLEDENNDSVDKTEETKNNNNNKDNNNTEPDNNTTEVVDTDSLFDTPESVGSVEENKQGKEDTSSEKTVSSPKKTDFYSSIANALKEDGIFQYLDASKVAEIKNAEDFAQAIKDEITSQFDERQKRIDAALSSGIEVSEIQKYESTIKYLDNISDQDISDESEKGEALRKQLIYNDYINNGYSKERAQREVKKSFDAGTDIEDAKESLKSNKAFFRKSYDNLIEEAEKAEKKEIENRKKDAETLRKSILEETKVFGDLQIDKATRQKAYDAISKPVYKDPDTGELFTALEKYELDNRLDFLKNIGLVYTLTDGFKNFDKFIKGKVKKEINKGLRELEHTINSTSRTADGSLRFVGGTEDDPDSYIGKGWKLDV